MLKHNASTKTIPERVVIMGAGGFIGSHLCESLVELGATVTALIHYNALSNQGWLSSSNHKKNISCEPASALQFL